MSDQEPDKTPAEQALDRALDVFVYAPIGLLFEGASLLPQLVEKGKSQVTMAKMVGRFALTQGQGEATKVVGQLQDQAVNLLDRFGGADGSDIPAAPVSTPSPDLTAAPAPETGPAAPTVAAGPVVEVDDLAIPDYDGLSASHVVNRLAGLSPAELKAVQHYEAANRGRKTILSKVAQLQAG